MWINFKATHPFSIKVYAGGVNAISGEPARETQVTMMRRLQLMQDKKNIQDYVVAPKQLWLDGIATGDGRVRQFVAMPLGKGYTVEAQSTGEEVIGGLQFEITPSKAPPADINASRRLCPMPEGTEWFQITVRNLFGEEFKLDVSLLHKVEHIKDAIEEAEGIAPVEQRLIYGGRQMEDGKTLAEHSISEGATIHLVLALYGGGGGPMPATMGLGAGGLIRQSIIKDKYKPTIWEPECGAIFNVQIVNSTLFSAITEEDPPATSVSAEAHAKFGFPYFKIFDEKPSGIEGNFEGVKSVNMLDAEGEPTEETSKAIKEASKSTSNPVVLLDHEGKRVGFRTVSDMEKAVRAQFQDIKI